MTFKTNLPVMVFKDFLICLPSKKKNNPIGPLKQQQKNHVYLKKKKITLTQKPLYKHISQYLIKNPIYLNLFFFSFKKTKILF